MLFVTPPLDDRELEVIASINETREGLRFMLREPRRWYGPLRRTASARNVQASNSIEGHNVTLDDAAAAIDGGEPLEASDEDWNAVHNYWDAMTYIIQLADDPHFEYSEALVRSLHFMMMRHDLTAMSGLYRPGGVFVWSTGERDVGYEGSDPNQVPPLLEELVVELNGDAGGSPAMVRAAMAHLNLVMLHPFKDGNGRMARALQTLVLAGERVLAPQFSSIEEYLGRNTPAYYDVLAEVGGGQWNPARDARPWIRFVLVAQYRQAHTLGRRIRDEASPWGIEGTAYRRLPTEALSSGSERSVSRRLLRRTLTQGREGALSDASPGRPYVALLLYVWVGWGRRAPANPSVGPQYPPPKKNTEKTTEKITP
jgi:Fic family protein